MIHCISHCSGCGSHFSSDRAFDLHRSGDPATGRFCWAESKSADRLRLKTKDGVCEMYAVSQEGVTIWEDGVAVDRARARFGKAGPENPDLSLGEAA